jgi:hypothetical protein
VRAGINLLFPGEPRNSKRYSRLDRVKLLSISPIVGDEACVVVIERVWEITRGRA